MTESEGRGGDFDEQNVRAWLRWLELEPVGCYLCGRILFESRLHGGQVKLLEIRGVELTREEQIAHLSRCVPERQQSKP
jgi:hypothetical protein